jgi:hypothetical protein
MEGGLGCVCIQSAGCRVSATILGYANRYLEFTKIWNDDIP